MKRLTINLNDEVYKQFKEMGEVFQLSPAQLIRTLATIGLKAGNDEVKKINQEIKKEI